MSTCALKTPALNFISLKGQRTPPPAGRPEKPSKWWALIVLIGSLLLPGCTPDIHYQAVPECPVIAPAEPERFIAAGADERLVMLGDTYIAQVKAVALCNTDIRLINASNKAVSE